MLKQKQKAIEDVGFTSGNFIKAAIAKDPSTTKGFYVLDYDGAEVNLEPTTGKVLYLRDKKNHTNVTKKVKTQDQAKEFAQSLYNDLQNKLNLTSGYKLAYIDSNLSDDFVLASFQKEAISGVISQFEQVKIGFDTEGKLESVKEFYTPVQSTDEVVTKDQAIAIATNNPDTFHKMTNPNPEDAKLEVVRPNYFKYTDLEDKAVLAWEFMKLDEFYGLTHKLVAFWVVTN